MVNGEAKTDGVVAAVGNFDGVHLGHQHLLARTAAFAQSLGARMGAVVFEPHPRRYFRPDDPPFLLTTPAKRDALLAAHGVETVLALPFDKTLAASSPEAFVRDVLKARLGLSGVVTGADFRFGKGRAGDGEALRVLGAAAGLAVDLVDVLAENPQAEKLGSSAVRAALQAGEPERAAAILGRRWSVSGVVEEGQRLGRGLGFPTANMTLGEVIEPRKGVYATWATVGDKAFPAVSNFGRRPTVGGGGPLLETHIFDFDGDLYGAEIEVAFVSFLRDERKFDGLDALKAQIAADSAEARRILRSDTVNA